MFGSVALANRWQNGTFGLAGGLAHALATPAHVAGLSDVVLRRGARWVPTHRTPVPVSAGSSGRPGRWRDSTQWARLPRAGWTIPGLMSLVILVGVNVAAAAVGAATAAAWFGYAAPARTFGLAAADSRWVTLPVACCLAQAAIFLMPFRRARVLVWSKTTGTAPPGSRPAAETSSHRRMAPCGCRRASDCRRLAEPG
jgi:hypothetical protein